MGGHSLLADWPPQRVPCVNTRVVFSGLGTHRTSTAPDELPTRRVLGADSTQSSLSLYGILCLTQVSACHLLHPGAFREVCFN